MSRTPNNDADLHAAASLSVAFLKRLDKDGRHNLVAIYPDRRAGRQNVIGRTFEPGDWVAMHGWMKTYAADGLNLYYSVNEPKADAPHDKLTKDDIEYVRALYRDIDPPKDVPFVEGRKVIDQRKMSLLADMQTGLAKPTEVPSALIDSGGGLQEIYFLDKKLPAQSVRDDVESVMRAGALKADADTAVAEIARVMRLPGFPNYPGKKKKETGRPVTKSSIVFTRADRFDLSDLRGDWGVSGPVQSQQSADVKTDRGAAEHELMADPSWVCDVDDLPESADAHLKAAQRDPAFLELWDNGADAIPANRDRTRNGRVHYLIEQLRALRKDVSLIDAAAIAYAWPQGGMAEKESEVGLKRVAHDIAGSYIKYTGSDGAKLSAVEDDDYGIPDEEIAKAKAEEIKNAKDKIQPYVPVDIDTLPPRPWEYGNVYMRGVVSLLAAFGGRGKSALTIVEALAMATGKPLLGVTPKRKLRVLLWNGEDSLIELQRRAGAACKFFGITADDLGDRLTLVSGVDVPLLFAEADGSMFKLHESAVKNLSKFIKARKIDIASFDPLVSVHRLNENDNTAMNALTGVFVKMAADLNIAIGLATHARKPNGKDETISANDARGGGALLAAVRVARVINVLKQADAPKLGISRPDAWRYSVVSDGKGNYAPMARDATIIRMESVVANNARDGYDADNSPVVVRFTPRKASLVSDEHRETILKRLGEENWITSNRSKTKRWVGSLVAQVCSLDENDDVVKAQIKQELDQWLREGLIVEAEAMHANRSDTIKVFRPVERKNAFGAAVDDEDEE